MFDPQISIQRLPSRDLNIRQRAAGGYDVVGQPNPNGGRGPYAGIAAGNYSMRELPGAEDRRANNLFAMGENRALAERGQQIREADRRAALERNPFSMQGIETVARDPAWEALFQAMWEASGKNPGRSGFGHVRTETTSLQRPDRELVNALMAGR